MKRTTIAKYHQPHERTVLDQIYDRLRKRALRHMPVGKRQEYVAGLRDGLNAVLKLEPWELERLAWQLSEISEHMNNDDWLEWLNTAPSAVQGHYQDGTVE
jgi:hypothetical protein